MLFSDQRVWPITTYIGDSSPAYASDYTWNNWGVPYLVDETGSTGGRLQVAVGVTLTIEPGVLVRFAGTELRIDGTLIADASPSAPITFTPDDGLVGGWYGLDFSADSDGSVLDHVVVEYASGDGLNISGADIAVSNSTVYSSTGDGISIYNAAPTFSNNTIDANAQDGIHLWGGAAPTLSGNAITGNSGYAVHMTSADRPSFDASNVVSGNGWDVTYCYRPHCLSGVWPN